jgi:hypothetical protein
VHPGEGVRGSGHLRVVRGAGVVLIDRVLVGVFYYYYLFSPVALIWLWFFFYLVGEFGSDYLCPSPRGGRGLGW